MKYIIITFIIFAMFNNEFCYGQFYQKADYGEVKDTKKNEFGGYDYFDKSGNRTGYSVRTHDGNFIYYDTDGNKTGMLKKENKDTYSFYDSANIKTGTVEKTPRGDFIYKRSFEGGLEGFTPPAGENIGYVDPNSFTASEFKKTTN